jgi:general secretion pathway protein H
MPTSATGISSRRSALAAACRRASGFTLLEVLVVIVIIGILTSIAVVSIHVLGGDHEMDQEVARLAAVLGQAREEAILQGRDLGLRLDEYGYDFLRYDSRLERWTIISDDPLLRARGLPEGVSLTLRLESRDVTLPSRAEPREGESPRPQVVVQASGDLVPFEVVLRRAGTEEVRRVAGSADGSIRTSKGDEPAAG